jgi:hypothetical protein
MRSSGMIPAAVTHAIGMPQKELHVMLVDDFFSLFGGRPEG